jgi:hypothetical protein
VDALRSSLRGQAPEVADALSEGVREEVAEQKRRMQGRRQSAPKTLFAQGVPVLEEAEEDAALQYQADPNGPSAIEPLSEKSVTSTLFSDRPGVNEAITVAKLTWKIFRSGKL